MQPREPWHGTRSGYNNRGCRCDDCRRAATEYKRSRRVSVTNPLAPSPAQRGAMSARSRYGDAPKVVRMDSLPVEARRQVLALVDELRAAARKGATDAAA